MRHTIKLATSKALVIDPVEGQVNVEVHYFGASVGGATIKPEDSDLLAWAFGQASQEARLQIIELASKSAG